MVWFYFGLCDDILAHINGWLRVYLWCTKRVWCDFTKHWLTFIFADRENCMPICSTILSFDVFIKRQNSFTMPAKLSAHSSRNSLCWMERTVCIHFFTSVISNSHLCCVSRLWLNLNVHVHVLCEMLFSEYPVYNVGHLLGLWWTVVTLSFSLSSDWLDFHHREQGQVLHPPLLRSSRFITFVSCIILFSVSFACIFSCIFSQSSHVIHLYACN